MKFNRNIYTLSILMASILFMASSCEKDDPVPPNETELITTVRYSLQPDNGGDAVVFEFKDLDGDGGDAPVVTEGTLEASMTYSGSLFLLDESKTPLENISNEVAEEAEEHQTFYVVDGGLNASITYNDADADNRPVGIFTKLTAGPASMGTIRIVLRHEPDKAADGVSDGNIANAGGETDIEVTFNVEIQ